MATREYKVNQTIPPGEDYETDPIDMKAAQGAASVQLEITGDGALDVEILGRNAEDLDWLQSEGKSALATGLTKASGTGGKWHKEASSDNLAFFSSIIFKFTNTSGTDSVVIKGAVAVR